MKKVSRFALNCFFHKEKDATELFKSQGISVLRCNKEGMVFVDHEYDFSYKEYHRDFSYFQSEKQFRNIFTKRVKKIAQFKKDGKALEVGCSTGVYLELLKKEGWEVWGIETSKVAAQKAKQKGIKVFTDPFEKAKLKTNSFDLVIFNHTLEHVENPLKVMEKVYNLLNKGGMVIVDLPNFGSLSEKLLGAKWSLLLPKEHPWQFTPETLELLFKRVGFEKISFDSSSGLLDYAYPLEEISLALSTLKKRFFTEVIYFPWYIIETLLNKGSNLSMIGFKK